MKYVTSVNGSVRRLCTDKSNFDMVSASDQLCWIMSTPTSPCRDTLGWTILVRKRTVGGSIGYLWSIYRNITKPYNSKCIPNSFLPLRNQIGTERYLLERNHNVQEEFATLVRTARWSNDGCLPMRQLRVQWYSVDSLSCVSVQCSDVAAQLGWPKIIATTLQRCFECHLDEAWLTEARWHQCTV